jgi:hypothetical protein
MVLLLVVFAGLLVMRYRGGVTFGLTRLIWKQVRCRAVVQLIHNFNFRKGIIWLILGCVAVVPPLVSLISP